MCADGRYSVASQDQQQPDWTEKKVFTTGEAASVCRVSQQTIIRCFDNGRLHGFRVPGSKFRRIPRDELLRFMRENGIPTDALEGSRRRVLIVDDDPQIVDLLHEMLRRDTRFELETASNGYDAGLLTERFRPHLIVLDYMLPDINGDVVCERIRENPDLQNTKVLFVSGVIEKDRIDRLLRAGGNGFLKKPFTVSTLLDEISRLLSLAPASS
jgi:two-component system OmpR family response regulator